MNVIIVEDDATLGGLMKKSLSADFDVRVFDNPVAAVESIRKTGADVVISDIKMPDMSGIELLKSIKSEMPDTYVILITGFGTVNESVEAVKSGAHDYILKPVDIDVLHKKLTDIRKLIENNELTAKFSAPVCESESFKKVLELAARSANVDSGVLITGETGSGKEVVARYIHMLSSKKEGPFVPVNCGNFQEQLFESELFGYRKGAFTGADRHKRGLAASADTGTLFLDEVGEMPVNVQAKLLRFLETKSYYPLGSSEPVTARARFIAATNRDLEEDVQSGKFRQDLFYRLNIVKIDLPPLRERKEDIIPLAKFFIKKFKHINSKISSISDNACKALLDYDYPGNVRELANLIERAMILECGNEITLATLNMPDKYKTKKQTSCRLDDVVKDHILNVLDSVNGNKTKAAEILGVDASTIHRKLKD